MYTLSVIIPVYNEQETVLQVLKMVRAQTIEDVELEIIVIDDGSKDGTLNILNANSDLIDRLIALPKNGGKGAAVKAGLAAASGDYVIFQDADLEYSPDEFSKLFLPVRDFNADVVMSSRFAAPALTRVFYFWNKIGNRFITLFFNILNNTTFTDIYSCYLLYRRDLVAVDQLKVMGWGQHAEILSQVCKNAERIYEVPISYHGRTFDEGKKIRAYHVISVIWTIFSQRFS